MAPAAAQPGVSEFCRRRSASHGAIETRLPAWREQGAGRRLLPKAPILARIGRQPVMSGTRRSWADIGGSWYEPMIRTKSCSRFRRISASSGQCWRTACPNCNTTHSSSRRSAAAPRTFVVPTVYQIDPSTSWGKQRSRPVAPGTPKRLAAPITQGIPGRPAADCLRPTLDGPEDACSWRRLTPPRPPPQPQSPRGR